jgi:hypothetical protein
MVGWSSGAPKTAMMASPMYRREAVVLEDDVRHRRQVLIELDQLLRRQLAIDVKPRISRT